jgi:glycosyltransferase involved in cell wall biosynthesis
MKRLLFVFPLELAGAGHGNVQRMQELGRYFRTQGFATDLICLGDPGSEVAPASTSACFDSIRFVGRHAPSSLSTQLAAEFETFHTLYPPSDVLRPTSALTALVRAELESGHYSGVVATYAWTAPMFANLASRTPRILDAQDILYRHTEACETATGSATAFCLLRETERYLWRQWEVIAAITDEDREEIAAHVGPAVTVVTSRHAVRTVDTPAAGADDVALYVGSDNDCNTRSFGWFLTEVWPLVRAARPAARLLVAGHICRTLGSPLPAGVESLGFVDDASRFVAEAGVIVAPYLYGSGLKIKVVEAAAAGKAVVTTGSGAAGSGLRRGYHASIEDGAADFATAVRELLGSASLRETLGRRALAQATSLYGPDACYTTLRDAVAAWGVAVSGVASSGTSRLIPGSALNRVATLLQAHDGRIFVYGAGSHTRALLPELCRRDLNTVAVLDRRATATTSLDGTDVLPFTGWSAKPGDVLLLSSQTFEQQMWEDLAPERSRGVNVLGLYDTRLLTPYLARRLDTASAPTARVAGSTVKGRLLIFDPNIRGSEGHYRGYAASVAQAAGEAGLTTVIAANQAARGAQTPTTQFLPAFEADYWQEMVHPPGVTTDEHLAQQARQFRVTLEAIAARLQLTRDDLLFLPCANLVETAALAEWAQRRPDDLPAMAVLYRFGLDEQAENTRLTETAVAALLRQSLASLRRDAGAARISVLSDSQALADAYATALGTRVHTVPIPVVFETTCDRHDSSAFTVTYLGDARAEKGFDQIPAIVDGCARQIADGAIRFVVQAHLNPSASAATREAVDRLRGRAGVALIERSLDASEYSDILAAANLILLPYDPHRYWGRTSGILAEAIVAGVPAVVPGGTWLSAVIDAGDGAGVVAPDNSGRSMAHAVLQAWQSRESLAAEALSLRSTFASRHNPRALVRQIFESCGLSPTACDGALQLQEL